MAPILRLLPVMLPALFCAGCTSVTGHAFTRPGDSGFVLGRTRAADVIAADGAPASRTVTTIRVHDAASPSLFDWAKVGGRYDILRYAHTVTTIGGSSGSRSAAFFLWDGTLYGYAYASSVAGQSTNFDAAKAQAALKAGGMTRASVLAMLGTPDGRMIYPMTSTPGDKVWQYQFIGQNKTGGRNVNKWLKVLFDPTGRVLDYKLTITDVPVPPVQAPIIVPIIIAH